MNESWRYNAKAITKYNPAFRNEKGVYENNEWVGFFQIGKIINGELLTFSTYSEVETKYINAARMFLEFHDCPVVIIKNLEKYNLSEYNFEDKHDLFEFNQQLQENSSIVLTDDEVSIRFGYDFYMYFNSPKNLDPLVAKIEKLGLFVL